MKLSLSTFFSSLLAISLFAAPALAQNPPTADYEAVYSQEELEQVLAPVALYPDALLANILMAATYPMEVVEAARFMDRHRGLQGEVLARQVEPQPWDASVKSLTAFPSVLNMMAQHLEWTQKLGNAFLAQADGVMDSIQNLRRLAQSQGNLRDTPQQRVVVEQQLVTIQPALPDMIYVPYYDPNLVYGAWQYPAYPPYYWAYSDNRSRFGQAVAAGVVFGVGVAVVRSIFSSSWRPDWRRRTFSSADGRRQDWRHDPVHRRGMAYRDTGSRQRYGPTPLPASDHNDFRGRDYRTPLRSTTPTHARPVNPFARIEAKERVERFSERGRAEMARPIPSRQTPTFHQTPTVHQRPTVHQTPTVHQRPTSQAAPAHQRDGRSDRTSGDRRHDR